MQVKTVAVVGPGGNVGAAVIKRLLEGGEIVPTAVARSNSTYAPSNGVKCVSADFGSHESVVEALRGHDALLCCVPGSAVQIGPQKALIDAAIEAGVKLFFASEYGGDIYSKNFKLNPPAFAGEKVLVREYLVKVAAENKIGWTALNGGAFFDMWLRAGFAGFDIAQRKAKIYDSGSAALCWTSLSTTVTAVVNMLRNPDPILNRAIFISGVVDLNQNSLLTALESETGETFTVERVEVAPVFEAAKDALAKGDIFQAVMGLGINSMFSDENSSADFWDRVVNELVGVKPMTVREAVKDVVRA